MKSEPTIVSAGFEKNLAGDAWPGPFTAWCRTCDVEMVYSVDMGLEWAPSGSTCDSCSSRVLGFCNAMGVLQQK